MKNLLRSSAAACAVALAACGPSYPPPGTPTPLDAAGGAPGADSVATVILRSSSGQELGTVTLRESADTLTVSGRLRGLPPGEHAAHLHAIGACTAPAFESAGPHWNPTMRLHGAKNPQGPHLGDMPNITVAADSSVTLSLKVDRRRLRGADGLLDADGASLVIHAAPDDDRTDPTGNAGARIACGVIGGT